MGLIQYEAPEERCYLHELLERLHINVYQMHGDPQGSSPKDNDEILPVPA